MAQHSTSRSFKKGHVPWNKGLTKEIDEKVKNSGKVLSITRKRLFKEGKLNTPKGAWKKGNKTWNKGKTKKSDERIRKIAKKLSITRKKMHKEGKLDFSTHRTKKYKDAMSIRKKKLWNNPKWRKMMLEKMEERRLENHWNWQGGRSFKPYGSGFWRNVRIHNTILTRDRHRCQTCGIVGNSKTLHIHHKDFTKGNHCPDNLITLCMSCHMKTHRIFEKEMKAHGCFERTLAVNSCTATP